MNTAVRYNKSRSYNRKNVNVRRVLFVAITVVAILLGMVIGNNVLSTSHSSASTEYEKALYYTSVEVEAGDTLWTIAEENMSAEFGDVNAYIDEIKAINNLHGDTIHAGAYLMVPYYEIIEQMVL